MGSNEVIQIEYMSVENVAKELENSGSAIIDGLINEGDVECETAKLPVTDEVGEIGKELIETLKLYGELLKSDGDMIRNIVVTKKYVENIHSMNIKMSGENAHITKSITE